MLHPVWPLRFKEITHFTFKWHINIFTVITENSTIIEGDHNKIEKKEKNEKDLRKKEKLGVVKKKKKKHHIE